jgi:hypothetical protein
MTLICTTLIVAKKLSARSLMPGGLVARANKATMSEGFLATTYRAGPFWPTAASCVGHYAKAPCLCSRKRSLVLSPHSLHSAKIGSVKVVQINVIPL